MEAFTLDTSGAVEIRLGIGPTAVMRWSDLSPFAQGYVEALFASLGPYDWKDEHGGAHPSRFSDLSPEALARVLADCERYDQLTAGHPRSASPAFALTVEMGRAFWKGRQASKPVIVRAPLGSGLTLTLEHFPPLRVILTDAGKVDFA